jgi:hypothetical protein
VSLRGGEVSISPRDNNNNIAIVVATQSDGNGEAASVQ